MGTQDSIEDRGEGVAWRYTNYPLDLPRCWPCQLHNTSGELGIFGLHAGMLVSKKNGSHHAIKHPHLVSGAGEGSHFRCDIGAETCPSPKWATHNGIITTSVVQPACSHPARLSALTSAMDQGAMWVRLNIERSCADNWPIREHAWHP